MSDPYPSYPPPPAERPGSAPQRGERPDTVNLAVVLLYVNVALGAIGLIVLFADKAGFKKKILESAPATSESTLDSAVTLAVVIGIVFLVLFALLAWQVGRGKNWARITTWVFAGLGVVSGLFGLAQPALLASRLLGILGLLIDVAVIVLLARPASSEYFRSQF
jgi:hypothetical protein